MLAVIAWQFKARAKKAEPKSPAFGVNIAFAG